MGVKSSDTAKQSKHITYIALATAAILSIPLIAMQFTDEVDWGFGDFVIMGFLVFGTGLAYELTTRKMSDATNKVAVAFVLAFMFFLVWAELAVGIFGTPFAGS